MKRKGCIDKMIALLLLSAGAIVMLFPFLWMILGAFKTDAEIMAAQPTLIPNKFIFDNFKKLFSTLNFGLYIRNTLIIVAYAFVGMFISAMAGYGFAKFNFKHKESYFYIVLATMMIPAQTLLIPVYLMIMKLNLLNTFLGMVLPAFVSGYTIFLFRQFMTGVPNEMLESARIDGAGEFRIFLEIALPLIKSAFMVQTIMTFMGAWNYFLYPLILSNDQTKYTISVAMSLIKNQQGTNYGEQLAGAALAVIPVVIVFAFFQKQIQEGFSTEGLKG